MQPETTPSTTHAEGYDPAKHFAFEMPDVMMMEDIGYPNDLGVSPVAVSKPFQLFTTDAIHRMRQEIFNVRTNHPQYVYESNIAPCQLRGYVANHAPFAYDAWTHPDTLAAVSRVAGVELVPWSKYEIAHINFVTKSEGQVEKELAELGSKDLVQAQTGNTTSCSDGEETPIVGWHKDSYPFVCVLMLSDCTTMVGGETALLKGNGEIERVRGPAMGCAVVLQGRYITHQALRALGGRERITAVTSFRPKSAFVRDDTVLTTVRPVSDLSTLYRDFSEYRMEMLLERFQAKLQAMRKDERVGKKTDVAGLKDFLHEQEQFIAHMNRELVPYEEVMEGVLPLEDMAKDISTSQHVCTK